MTLAQWARVALHVLSGAKRRDDRRVARIGELWESRCDGIEEVGRALYVSETMIHMAITEGIDPSSAVSKHLNDLRDSFAIPYAGERPE